MIPSSNQSTSNLLEELLKTQPALWRGCDQYNDYTSVPTGYAQLDKALPSGGWGIGCLTELLLEQHGIGEISLLLPGLQQITSGCATDGTSDGATSGQSSGQSGGESDGQWAAFVNPLYLPYAPALANAGINLERLLIINTDNDNDTLWATEQLLRTGLFASVVSWVNRTTAQKQRRLQLAAELGNTWATVYRPASAQDQHSPAALRIVVSAATCNIRNNNNNNNSIDPISNATAHYAHSSASYHMNLEIIKSRGGKQHSVQINPNQFDRSQGVEWPAMPQHIHSTSLPQCREQCLGQCGGQCGEKYNKKINAVIRAL